LTSNAAPHESRHDDPDLPAPRSGRAGSGRADESAPQRTAPDPPKDSWSSRAREARQRLVPERTTIPAPRTPGGVEVPPAFGRGPGAAPAPLVRAADALVTKLAAVEEAPDQPTHKALLRIGTLVATGVPDRGWSAGEDLDAEVLGAAAELAGSLHEEAASLLEKLDAAERPSPAVVIDALVMSLRVTRMVAELEVFARTTHA
jgi:hypothetical protein